MVITPGAEKKDESPQPGAGNALLPEWSLPKRKEWEHDITAVTSPTGIGSTCQLPRLALCSTILLCLWTALSPEAERTRCDGPEQSCA
jgi:hypothetical protein